mmetsp:Transcript_2721/g.6560  ORF Transcript_2721/g.6560 Transcript_2721/m.6560 type:complete len:184 (-) Transcript_2721:135-686(-)
MVKYSREPENALKSAKARGSDLRVHFKNTHEVSVVLKNMELKRANRYLQDVVDKKQIVPMRRYSNGSGRSAQAHAFKASAGRWPQKSCHFLLDLLRNAESNAEVKGLDTDNLYISHIQVNKARQGRRRTYRAHGRINPFKNCPCHIELVVSEREEPVAKPESEAGSKKSKKAGQARLKSGTQA